MKPTEINPLDLPSVPLEQRSQLPETPCIYFAIDSQDIVQYIGRSKNPRQRWKAHSKGVEVASIGCVKIAYLEVSQPELLLEIENALIQWFNPPLNEIAASGSERKTPLGEARVDISAFWLKDDDGEPRSVNSVYEQIKDTPNEVGRNTLRLALDGTLDRGYFSNLVKLARLCSIWSGRTITPNDLLRVEE